LADVVDQVVFTSMLDPRIEQLVEQIHASSHKLVLEFAGAASLGLFWLHAVAGSSRTILEASDRYASTSLADLLGAAPERFVDPETAAAMAERAYERAVLLGDSSVPVLGVACTATIATDRVKKGEHRCFVAVRAAAGVTTYGLTLTKGLRDRLGEETLVSQLLLRAIADACGAPGPAPLDLASGEEVTQQRDATADPIALLLEQLRVPSRDEQAEAGAGSTRNPQPETGAINTVTIRPNGTRAADEPFNGVLLSGSFNPLHVGHERLLAAAAALLNMPAAFELPIVNADKAPLSHAEVLRRMRQFAGRYTAILSTAPLFVQKAALFPGCVFVVGYDTAERLVAPRYYAESHEQMLEALEAIRAAGCRFLVAGRLDDGVFKTLGDLGLPPALAGMFIELPESLFRADISSTELRALITPTRK
jgi:hypothetical protein